LKTGGNFEYDTNLVICPSWNWLRKRSSWDQKRRMSGMSNKTCWPGKREREREQREREREVRTTKAEPQLVVVPVYMYIYIYVCMSSSSSFSFSYHGQPLQPEPEGPSVLEASARIAHDVVVHHSAAQHLQPAPAVQHLQLERGRREGKIVGAPPHLHLHTYTV
jgi:hypothetical protein